MAFFLGCVAIALWGSLALFTIYTDGIPALQLSAMTFFIATIIGLIYSFSVAIIANNKTSAALAAGQNISLFSRIKKNIFCAPLLVVVFGVTGLFGYHFFYFLALKNAPPESASLIAYLWPLLIVIFSALLPGSRLTLWHIAGALIALTGCYFLVTKGQGFSVESQFTKGYLAALACAFIWSSYSIMSRRFEKVSTEVVTLYCFFTAILALACHFLLEDSVWPLSTKQLLGVLGLGIGPVGVAFFCWDYAMKKGPIKILGVMSYFAPLISTILLGITSAVVLTQSVWLGCALIVIGAVISAKEYWYKKP